MKRFLIAPAIALLAILSLVPVASARGRVFAGGGYGYYGGGFYGPAWGGWYGPRGYPYGYYRNSGDVKIETHEKGNSIFIDGGFAGVTGKLKKFPLRTGTHTLEVRRPDGRTFYQERIEVIAGRTLKIYPDYKG